MTQGKITPAKLVGASLNTDEAGMLLATAARAALEGKSQVDAGKAKGAAALAVMTAGFCADEIMWRKWTFDMVGNDGQVKHHVQCIGWAEFGSEGEEWRVEPKKAQSAYKVAFVSQFLGLPDCPPAVWTMASKAISMAKAIAVEGMEVTIEDGKLKLSGGTTDRAAKMAAAKSLHACQKVAEGKAGTEQAGQGAGATKAAAPEAKVATPEEITRAAVAIVKIIAKGEADACNATLSNLRAIAKLVASNPAAFAEV